MNEIERAQTGMHQLGKDLEAWSKKAENRDRMNLIRLVVAIVGLLLGTKMLNIW
jgi:hypothetical protein